MVRQAHHPFPEPVEASVPTEALMRPKAQMVRQAHHPVAEPIEVPYSCPSRSLSLSMRSALCDQNHPFHKPRAQRDASGHIQKPFTVLGPIPERGGQPHQSASRLSASPLSVPVVCVMKRSVLFCRPTLSLNQPKHPISTEVPKARIVSLPNHPVPKLVDKLTTRPSHCHRYASSSVTKPHRSLSLSKCPTTLKIPTGR